MIVGIGVDVVDIPRMREIIDRQQDRFVRRVFTAVEQEFCRAHRDPIPHYAVRFAAKEALFKALGTGWAKGVGWLDVEVTRKNPEPPRLVLYGEAERRVRAAGVQSAHISLSHGKDTALAMVVLEK